MPATTPKQPVTRPITAKGRPPSSPASTWGRTLLLGALLFAVTVLVYFPAMKAGFIWDDDQEITQNWLLRDARGLYLIWNPFENPSPDYFPVKSTMLWLEYHLWGFLPGAVGDFRDEATRQFAASEYHTVNILVHAVDVILIWRLLLALEIPAAWFAALIFAVHPVNAESVAWISERKNTLSTFFYLLSLLAWVRFDIRKHWKWLACSLAAFLAALLSKSAVVFLPCVLLMVVWWRHRRVTLRDAAFTIPFFVLSLALGILTVYLQNTRAIGAEVIRIGGFPSRAAGAGMAVWFYLSKILVPFNLMDIYPRWEFEHPAWYMFLPGILLLLLFALLLKYRDGWARAPLFGFGYFVVCLFPALGFFKMSYMRLTLVSDHFTYFGILGIIALVCGSAGWYARRSGPIAQGLLCGGGALIALLFSVMSWQRAALHLNEKTLWTETVKRNPGTWQGHNHLGAALYGEGKILEAHRHFADAVRLKPDNPEVHNNLALVLTQEGHLDQALPEYFEAVRIKPDDPNMQQNLGNALADAHRFDEAIVHYREVLEYIPTDLPVLCNLGVALTETGHLDEAIATFQRALAIQPDFPPARQNLAQALQAKAAQDRQQKSRESFPTP